MQKSSFVDFLSKLSAQEMKSFNDFVSSDYWNTNAELRLLLKIMSTIPDLVNSDLLDRNQLWKELFPDKKFNYNKLRLLFSKGLKLLESFIAIDKLKYDEQEFELLKLKAIGERGVQSRLRRKRTEVEDMLEKTDRRDRQYFFRHSEMSRYLDDYLDRKNANSIEHIKMQSAQLDSYYYIEKVKICTEIIQRSRRTNIHYPQADMDHLEKYLENTPDLLNKVPVLKIHFYLYLLAKYPEREETINKLKETIKENSKLVSKDQNVDILNTLLNYYITKINSGKREFVTDAYQMMKTAIETDLFLRDGTLQESAYTTFVSMGIETKDYSYLKTFIEKFVDFLPEEVRENAFTFQMAHLYFVQGIYDEAQSLLQRVEYTRLKYIIGSKVMLLQIYFDTNEYQLLTTHINTTKIYLKRIKARPSFRYQRYYKLFSFTQSLYNIKKQIAFKSEEILTNKIVKLEAQIIEEKTIRSREWLLLKISELKNEVVSE